MKTSMRPHQVSSLTAAAGRLRNVPGFPRRPGRPRKAPPAEPAQTSANPPRRLLDLKATATYLGISGWSVRDLEAAGVLHRVRVPLPNELDELAHVS